MTTAPRQEPASTLPEAALAEVCRLLEEVPTRAAQVLVTLEALQEPIDELSVLGSHSSLACFNTLYADITGQVVRTIETGGFADGPAMDALDVAFYRRYAHAVATWLRGGQAPLCWLELFRHLDDTGVTDVQKAAAGVNAHVNYDLALALLATWRQLDLRPATGSFHDDYQAINKIFHSRIPELVEFFDPRPDVRGLDLLDDRTLAVEDGSVVFTRDLAWFAATVLFRTSRPGSAVGPGSEHRALDLNAAGLGALLLSPPATALLEDSPHPRELRARLRAHLHHADP